MGPGQCGQGRGGVPSCPRCPGRGYGHRLCSRDDAGSSQAAGSQPGPCRLPATPWKAEIPARTGHRAAGKRPCPRARANKPLGACLDTKVMGASPGEQWGRRIPAVRTGQQQLNGMEVSWGEAKEGQVTPPPRMRRYSTSIHGGYPNLLPEGGGPCAITRGKMLVASSTRPDC